MINNKTYYPTPKRLIGKMFRKIQNKSHELKILEPSAGKGDIVDYLKEAEGFHSRAYRHIDVIEKDLTLQATLRGKGANVVDSDFLLYSGPDKYDLIIANPPFNEGDLHLLKAIDIMYSGEIIFLLNAETIKNPYSNTRKLLIRKLTELNAEIEYIQDGFVGAERKTQVEIALVYINIKRKVEDDLFDGCKQSAPNFSETIDPDQEVQTLNMIKNMVDDYNRVVKVGTETLLNYYQNYTHISQYIKLAEHENKYKENGSLTKTMQDSLNLFVKNVRIKYWKDVLQLSEISKRLTKAKADVFYQQREQQAYMDFTEYNIRTFVLNIIDSFEQNLIDAVITLFDRMTQKFSWHEGDIQAKNIHYFNGWKTNKAFFVNNKVILPDINCWHNTYGQNRWEADYKVKESMRDIDIVMDYFAGMTGQYNSIQESLENAFSFGITKKIHSTYFTITVFKKGTVHLTFNSEDIRRRFNVTACKGKNWLPQDYGAKAFESLTYEEQCTVESFEDKKTYDNNLNNGAFVIPDFKFKMLT